MRDILSKVMTGSMIAGAALLVAACGSSGNNAAANNAAADNGVNTTVPALPEMNDMNGTGTTGTDVNGTGTTGTDVNVSTDANGMNVAVNGQ